MYSSGTATDHRSNSNPSSPSEPLHKLAVRGGHLGDAAHLARLCIAWTDFKFLAEVINRRYLRARLASEGDRHPRKQAADEHHRDPQAPRIMADIPAEEVTGQEKQADGNWVRNAQGERRP